MRADDGLVTGFRRRVCVIPFAALALLVAVGPASAQVDLGGVTQPVGGTVGGVGGTVGGLLPGPGGQPEVVPAPIPGGTPGVGGAADALDSVAPVVRVVVPSRARLATVLSRGVPLKVRCNEACVFASALVLDGRTAKKLRLSRGTPVVAGQTWGFVTLPTGTAARLKLTGRYARALGKASKARGFRSIRLTMVSRGSDRSANTSGLVGRRITLTR